VIVVLLRRETTVRPPWVVTVALVAGLLSLLAAL